MKNRLASNLLALAAAAGLASAVSAQTINIVAQTVNTAPGVSGGFFTTSFLDNPVIDASGAIAFRSNMIINGTTVTAVNQRGIWYGTPGNLTLAARSGDQAPGMAAGVFMNTATSGVGLGAPVRMNSAGQMLFGTILTGTGIVATPAAVENDSALFVGNKGSISKVLQRLDAAPGTGFNFNAAISATSLQSCIMNNSGAIAIRLTTNDTNTAINDAVWAGQPNALVAIAQKGIAAPGMGGAKWPASSAGFSQIINHSGQGLFDTKFAVDATAIPAVTTLNDSTLWAYTPGSGSVLICREGQVAPDATGAPNVSGATFNVPAAGTFWSVGFGAADYNNSGEALLQLEMAGGDVAGTTNNSGLFLWDGTSLKLKVRRGDPAPGTDGLFELANNSSICINNNHQVAFRTQIRDAGLLTVTAANDTCVYVGTLSSLSLVLREGDPAPGTGNAFIGGTFTGSPVLNDNGYVVVNCDLTGPAVVPGVDSSACYALKAGQAPILLARGGQPFEVTPGVFKSISTTTLSYNQFSNGNGIGQSINNQNKLGARLFFADSTSAQVVVQINDPYVCYANCDGSDVNPLLTANDFQCFLNKFAGNDTYANCDGSTSNPVLTANDFQCFLNAYAAGCS